MNQSGAMAVTNMTQRRICGREFESRRIHYFEKPVPESSRGSGTLILNLLNKNQEKKKTMTTYLILVALWTLYMGFETYVFSRPQSRPHFVGFLITHTLLAPISFVLSATAGVLRDRVESVYTSALEDKKRFAKTDRKKLIG